MCARPAQSLQAAAESCRAARSAHDLSTAAVTLHFTARCLQAAAESCRAARSARKIFASCR